MNESAKVLPPTNCCPKITTGPGLLDGQTTEHAVMNRLLTTTPVQTSLPLAVIPLGTFGPQLVTMYIPMNDSASIGASVRLLTTTPAWSSTTWTLPSVALPELLTEPVNMTISPSVTGGGPQSRVTRMAGVVTRGQAALAVAVTWLPAQRSCPTAGAVSAPA